MQFATFLAVALIAFTSTTRAGTLHDRRKENLIQQMRRNKAPNPASSELSVLGSTIATTTALEGLNSTIGLNATSVVETSSPTSELLLTSETAAINATACPPAVTFTVTVIGTSISTVQVCGDQITSIPVSDPAQATTAPIPVISQPLANTTPASGDQLFRSSEIAIPAPTESTVFDKLTLSQPAPLEDGAVTTQVITQTISSPATTLVSEFVACKGRGRNQRCKVTTVTEEQEEIVGIETVTLVVTQTEGVNLVTQESGIADTPTATVVDGIATEMGSPVPSETAAQGRESIVVEQPTSTTDENAALESSTSCADAGVTLSSIITVDASVAASLEGTSETTAPILTTQNPANENTLYSKTAATSSASITISAVAPDAFTKPLATIVPPATDNIITESMISILTLTRSVVPIEVTFGTGATQESAIVTPQPETILLTITLGPGGVTGIGTDAAQPTGGTGNGSSKEKDKKKENGTGKGQDKDNERVNGGKNMKGEKTG